VEIDLTPTLSFSERVEVRDKSQKQIDVSDP
jgi:hypothetical protein